MNYDNCYSLSSNDYIMRGVPIESTECLNTSDDGLPTFSNLSNVGSQNGFPHSDIFSELDFEPTKRESDRDDLIPGPSRSSASVDSGSDDYYRFYYENDEQYDHVIQQLEEQIAKEDEDISSRERTIMETAKKLIADADAADQEQSLLKKRKQDLKKKKSALHIAQKERKVFCCFICGRSFLSEELVRQHISLAHLKDDKSFKFDCPKCYMKFKMFHHMKRHLKTHTSEIQREFRCLYCPAVYKESVNLEIHMSSVHCKSLDGADLKQAYRCRHCMQSFGIEPEYKRHLYYCEHKDEIALKRKEAKKNLVLLGSLTSSPAMTISSAISSPAYSTISGGSAGRPIKDKSCPFCYEIFASMQSRNRHIARKHPEKANDKQSTEYKYVNTCSPDLPFGCSECGKTFASHASLSTHKKRIHTKELNFECAICSKRYPLASELKKHEKVHQKSDNQPLTKVEEDYRLFEF